MLGNPVIFIFIMYRLLLSLLSELETDLANETKEKKERKFNWKVMVGAQRESLTIRSWKRLELGQFLSLGNH